MAILEVQRLQAEGFSQIVDALVQGTAALHAGHPPSGTAFESHLLSFDAAARGVAFHNVEDEPGNEEERRGLFTSSCAALAALAEKMGNRRDAEGQTGHDEV